MRQKTITYPLLAALTCLAAACSNDDEPKTEEQPIPTSTGVYVLSQGVYGMQIEGSLALVDYATGNASTDLFQKANGRSLGATPQTGICYGSKLYIGMYESNTIEIADRATCHSIKQISLSEPQGQSPRSMVAHDGKVYVSMYNGYVARLDTLTMEIDATVKVGPNPDIIAIKGDKLYVPNSDGMNWQEGYGTTASVVDMATFKVVQTLEVPLNPTKFDTDGTDLYLLAMGNYNDVMAAVYHVDDNGVCEQIAQATLMCAHGGKVYMIDAPYWSNEPSYTVYDSKTGRTSAMLADRGVDSPAAIAIDSVNGNIVISSYALENGYTSYTTDGYVNVYDNGGRLLSTNAVGVGPVCIFF